MDTKIVNFMQITGIDAKTARHYLEAYAGNTDAAIGQYFTDQSGGRNVQSSNRSTSGSQGSGGGSDNLRSPIRDTGVSNLMFDDYGRQGQGQTNQGGGGFQQHVGRFLPGLFGNFFQGGGRGNRGGGRNSNRSRNRKDQRGRGGFRNYPPTQFQQQGRQPQQKRSNMSKFTQDSEIWQRLFSPPTDLLFLGTFDEAMDKAKEVEKWLLVNIQDDRVFHSMTLNRDVWKNEVMKSFVAANFVFWQKDIKTQSAKDFKDLYLQDKAIVYPYICIINPLSGEVQFGWNGEAEVKTLMMRMEAFVSKNKEDLKKMLALKTPKPGEEEDRFFSPVTSNPILSQPDDLLVDNTGIPGGGGGGGGGGGFGMEDDNVLSEEDQLLQFAIRESMKSLDSNSSSSSNGDDEDKMDLSEDEPQQKQQKEFEDQTLDLSMYLCGSSHADAARFRINLPDGKREIVTVLKSSPTAVVYGVFRARLEEEDKGRDFNVVFFNRVIDNGIEKTIEGDKLNNSNLTITFNDN